MSERVGFFAGNNRVEIRRLLPHKASMISSDAFTAIADPNRRYLLEELRRGPKTVNQLASGLPVSRPAVSQHLKVLLDAGLVSARVGRDASASTPSARAGFMKLNIWLDQFWEG